MSRIRLLIADAQILFAEALRAALKRWPGLEALDELPATAQQAIDAVAILRPDVVLIDYHLPEMHGHATARMISANAPGTKILVLSWFYGPREIKAVLEAGASGFLPKSLHLDQVADAIMRAHAGEKPVYADELARVVERVSLGEEHSAKIWAKLLTLTPREIDILRLLNAGHEVKEVAKSLKISESTVRTHIHNMLEKTETRYQTEVLALARHYGLIQS